mmetsp:Transcript_36696/g.86580  ORF Transcript_36696/g.86580 Transcript_36696/m.86580 type:complete len:89 (-) Transcript_36696:1080-1346(-)
MQDGDDCESVQFISGLAFAQASPSHGTPDQAGDIGDGAGDTPRAGEIVLSFGVNDCESRLGRIDLAQVWRMLVPLPCATPPCAACALV